METITSRDNAKIKYACAVRDTEKQRAADGVFFAEGPKLCLELAKSCTPRVVYATAAALAKTPELARFDPRRDRAPCGGKAQRYQVQPGRVCAV